VKNKSQTIREILKDIPSVDQLIIYCKESIDLTLPQVLVKQIVRTKLKEVRVDIKNNIISKNIREYCYEIVLNQIRKSNNFRLKTLINGTGIVLHTGFGRAPLSKKILKDSIDRIYPYSNLEYIVKENHRGERNHHIDYLINALTGSESSLIVNNNAAAVLLILNTLSQNKEVIISRGELVEIGGSFRIPEVIDKANCKMVEIGTTNKTHLKDFKNAINKNTGMIMIAHTSNYKVVGFTESVELQDIVRLAKSKKIPIFLDLGSGAIVDYTNFNLPKEKLINEYLKLGVDIISFSGDKLIGGPQAGIICARKTLINKIHSNSMYRALRCNKITISLMESILRTYIDSETVNNNNLTFELLTNSRSKLKLNGKNILRKIDDSIIKKYDIRLIESYVHAGSGSLPIENIESMALTFNSKNISASYLSKIFRYAKYPIVGYIKSKIFHIDLKAIPTDQIKILIETINLSLK